jgi:glycerophosphoryl diester phosphodiesterase
MSRAKNTGCRAQLLCLFLLLLLPAGCAREQRPSEPALATLSGRAVLPADTFTEGPGVGSALVPEINGRHLPFASVPAQGFSSLLALGGDRYLALQDNGFGTLANSADYPLRWLRLQVTVDNPPAGGGTVTVLDFTSLGDPGGLLPFPLAHDDSARALSGADLDPEGFAPQPDGSYWLGEEFGPCLVHFNARGEVLEKPVDIPVVPGLRAYARGSPFFRTPDHPDLRFLRQEETREELANLPRSGGVEGLAATPNGSRLYVALEKGLLDDPVAARRVILEFNPSRRSFTGNHWLYLVDRPDVSVASLEALDERVLLIVERDGAEGAKAEIKRIYRVELGEVDAAGFLRKTLVCDLLNLDDEAGLTHREKGAVGLGRYFRFPYVTPECLVVLNDSTLLVANDNNYPFSAGRRPPTTPDDTEFIRLRLHHPVSTWPPLPE